MRWIKVLRDLGAIPIRAGLAVAAMVAGVFGLGVILTAYSILNRELAATFMETSPASAILHVEPAILHVGPGDDGRHVGGAHSQPVTGGVRRSSEMTAIARAVPGVLEAEAGAVIGGRVRVGQDEWMPLVLFVVPDFDRQHIDRFTRGEGSWPPGDDEVLLERTALTVARARIGTMMRMRTADGVERSLRVAGTVHAAALPPAWMDHVVTGFVTTRSVALADWRAVGARLRIVVREKRLDETHIRAVATEVRSSLQAKGWQVSSIDVPPPGRHPHADQMDTFLFLLGAFGALTLLLSALVVANMIDTILAEQVRQVGIMKTIGASTGRLAWMYVGEVSILAALALAIGMPLGLAAGRAYTRFAATILNANIASAAVPLPIWALQVGVGILVPLLFALGPVYRASRITIQQSFSGGLSTQAFGARPFDRWLARLTILSRPLMLAFRATFHRRGRLILTVGTLAFGGAAFIAAMNVSAAWDAAIADDYRSRHYDIDVRLSQLYPVSRIDALIRPLPEVARAEYWPDRGARLVRADGIATSTVRVVAPDSGSKLLAFPMLAGRWLTVTDDRAVVINQTLAAGSHLGVGNRLNVRYHERDASWLVIGVVKDLSTPTAYASGRDVRALIDELTGTTRTARIATRQHEPAAQLAAVRRIERALESGGIDVGHLQSRADQRKAIEDHLVIIKSALILAALLVVLVGGIGLTSTLTLNVIERTRELGVLRAIGATPGVIARNVVFEGVVMGVASWCAAIVVAAPVTIALADVAGRIFIKSELDFIMSPWAIVIWLLLVIALSMISSFYPAWRSFRMTIREALSYE